MSDLVKAYENVKSPLDDKENIKKLYAAYYSNKSNYANAITNVNSKKDDSQINKSDREVLFVNLFNNWKHNISSLNNEQIENLKLSNYEKYDELKLFLQSTPDFNDFNDINMCKQYLEKMDMADYSWDLKKEFGSWNNIKSIDMSAKQEQNINIKHKLNINSQKKDLYLILNKFAEKCNEEKIPFNLKFEEIGKRDDNISIYSSTEDLTKYIEILESIAKDNPEIIKDCGHPPILTGKINKWIGISDEPKQKNESFTSIRANIIEEAMLQTNLKLTSDLIGKKIIQNGRQISFKDVFIEKNVSLILDNLNNLKKTNSHEAFLISLENKGIKEEHLTSQKFREYLAYQFKANISKGLDGMKDNEYRDKTFFSIATKDGKEINISKSHMENVLKEMSPILVKNEPNLLNILKNNILEEAKNQNIDNEKFCFNNDTKEFFEEIRNQEIANNSLEKFKRYSINTQERIHSVLLTEKQINGKQNFVNSFIKSYECSEDLTQYKDRVDSEEKNALEVIGIIRNNGYVEEENNAPKKISLKNKKTENEHKYTSKQIEKMAQLLKISKEMTLATGDDYLSTFINVPDVDYTLISMKLDKTENLRKMKDKANKNVIEKTLPDFPPTDFEKDPMKIDEIIKKCVEKMEKELELKKEEEIGSKEKVNDIDINESKSDFLKHLEKLTLKDNNTIISKEYKIPEKSKIEETRNTIC